jgi:hypothetical protein
VAAIGLSGGVVIYEKRKKAAAAATASTEAAAASSQQQADADTANTPAGDPLLIAYQTGEASGVSSYSSGVGTGIGLVESILGQFPTVGSTSSAPAPTPISQPSPPAASPAPASPSGGVTTTPAAATATTPGYGIVQTALGPMVWLGTIGSGKGFQVGGGAPVYFGNAQALATGSKYEKAPYDVYTPQAYAAQVAKTATAGGVYA